MSGNPPTNIPPDRAREDAGALRALILAGERFRQLVADLFDLTVSETVALSQLTTEARSPHELAVLLGLTPSSITSVLDRLEAVGMAERNRHPTDRRRTVISITPRGQQVMDWSQQRLSRAVADAEKQAGSGAADMLRALADSLTAQTRPEPAQSSRSALATPMSPDTDA